MIIPTKKLNSGFTIPMLGLGTYGMGGPGRMRGRDFNNDDPKDIAAITASINLGITHIDTAESYASGHSEELVSQAIQGHGRNKLFIASKVFAGHMQYAQVIEACKGSLRRIGTDYLDLYYLHRYPDNVELEESLKAMNDLVDQGLIKYIGISNFNLQHTKDAIKLSKYPIAATQVHYSLIFREPAVTGLLEYCQKHDVMLVAWRPLNKGALTKSGINITKQGIPILDQLCKKYQKTPAQISINWLISQDNVVTLAKTSSLDHLHDNLGALGWQMEKLDVEWLRNEFPNQETVSDTVPLA